MSMMVISREEMRGEQMCGEGGGAKVRPRSRSWRGLRAGDDAVANWKLMSPIRGCGDDDNAIS